MHRTVVGVFRGGPSNEHEVSLQSGHTVIKNLDTVIVRDIYIDRGGQWHTKGLPVLPGDVLPTIDLAFLALHGEYGEDGQIQKILDLFGTPYTGADAYHSYQSAHKVLAKEVAKKLGLKTPDYRLVERLEDASSIAYEVVRNFHQPVIVKPVSSGSSVGVSLVSGYLPIQKAIETLFLQGAFSVLIEERVAGVETTVGIIDDFRGELLYALPPVEIVPAKNEEFFTYEAKYSGTTEEIVPGRFEKNVSEALREMGKIAHRGLSQKHYSRSDFIVSPKGIYFLELNSAPAVGLTKQSLFPKALASVGVSMKEFLTHIVELAVGSRKR